jgi:hypothetical protein
VIYDVGNPGSFLGQAHKYVGVKSLNWLMGSQQNEWKSYGNNIYLFGLNKLKWLDAKVSKIVINKNKV